MRSLFVLLLLALAPVGTGLLPARALAQVESPRPVEELEREARKSRAPGKAAEEPAADTGEEDDAQEAPPPSKGRGRKQAGRAEEKPAADAEEDPDAEPEDTGGPVKVDEEREAPEAEAKPSGPAKPGPVFGPELPPPPPGHSPDRPLPKPLVTSPATDEDLLALWSRWRKSTASLDAADARKAQAELVRLKEDLGIADLDAFAIGFVRASEVRLRARDASGAVELAQAAVALAPHLPYSHVGLTQAYLSSDPGGLAWLSESQAALRAMIREPRFLRPVLADLGAGLLFALAATAVAVVLALFLRKLRCFLHDFHHLFPKASARWQSATAAVLLLLLPVVFHLGLVPVLLVLLAAVTFYLGRLERVLAALLVAALGAIPVLAGLVVEGTGFAGTPAEDVARLECGGPAGTTASGRILKRLSDGKADFAEVFALGRFELRRGQLDRAVEHFKLAAARRNNEPRVLTNLANALLLQGDADGALELYRSATQADASLAAPYFNLSRLHSRRAAALPDDAVGLELDKAHTAIATAQKLDEALLSREELPVDQAPLANRLLLSPPLASAEIIALASSPEAGARVRAQMALILLGGTGSAVFFLYPLVLAGLVVALGFSARRFNAARECEKCGRSVCRRCDPELGTGSMLCAQCVNVYARKGVVPAPLKVRKQLEVARHADRMGKLSYLLGMLCSGAGHLFSGLPLRGTVYAFLFSFALFNAFFRQGVVRSPYGALPLLWRLLPVVLLFLSVYLLSLRGLYRRQSE